MIDMRPALYITGYVLIALSASMIFPAFIDYATGNSEWQDFFISAGFSLFFGVGLVLANRIGPIKLDIRQAVLVTLMIWTALPLFASIPFMLSHLSLSFTDAYFESMSGLTTTGSTVITGLDTKPGGILLWRGILQWLGGLGIIVMAIGILPMLRVGGMQMFKVEAFDTAGKDMPRMAEISSSITILFIGLTATWMLLLWLAGMSALEAATHAMSTIATGGYSTSDASIGHFDSPIIEIITTFGMLLGGIPFLLYIKFVRGRRRSLFQDSQVRSYLGILLLASLAITAWLILTGVYGPLDALREASFSVVSIMTGTGFVSADYSTWGSFPVGAIFFLTFVGGCSGSTACGIKVFRFQILYEMASVHVRQIIYPNGIFIPRYNGNKIEDDVAMSVWAFFFLFVASFAVLTIALNLTGMDFTTALSSSATAISNVGPGMGSIVGPSGNFENIPTAAKWFLSFGMLVGRLEVLTIIVVFSRAFWKG